MFSRALLHVYRSCRIARVRHRSAIDIALRGGGDNGGGGMVAKSCCEYAAAGNVRVTCARAAASLARVSGAARKQRRGDRCLAKRVASQCKRTALLSIWPLACRAKSREATCQRNVKHRASRMCLAARCAIFCHVRIFTVAPLFAACIAHAAARTLAPFCGIGGVAYRVKAGGISAVAAKWRRQ